jgi:hypothetical protein
MASDLKPDGFGRSTETITKPCLFAAVRNHRNHAETAAKPYRNHSETMVAIANETTITPPYKGEYMVSHPVSPRPVRFDRDRHQHGRHTQVATDNRASRVGVITGSAFALSDVVASLTKATHHRRRRPCSWCMARRAHKALACAFICRSSPTTARRCQRTGARRTVSSPCSSKKLSKYLTQRWRGARATRATFPPVPKI